MTRFFLAPDLCERKCALRIDKASEGRCIGLVANMPVMCPGKLRQAGAFANVGHAGQAEIDAIGENGGKQSRPVIDRPAAALMREAFAESGPGCRSHGRQHGRARYCERPPNPAWSKTLACVEALCTGTGRSRVWPADGCRRSASGRRGVVADDARAREV